MSNQAKKAQKKLARRKAFEHQRNMQGNRPKPQYRLDVKMGGGWRMGVMAFMDMERVKQHVAEMEVMRKKGTVEIIEGNVVEIRTGKVVEHIEPFMPAAGVADLGKAAGPEEKVEGVTGNWGPPRGLLV